MDARAERILVTGAQGFVGRYLVALLAREKPAAEILGVGRSPRLPDRFTHRVTWGGRAVPAPLPASLRVDIARVRYASIDLHDDGGLAALVDDFQPDIVFHVAAALRDDPPEAICRANIAGLVNLMDALARARRPIRRAVLVSSGGVYGRPRAGAGAPPALSEEMACSPLDLYSMSKLAGEYSGRALASRLGVPVVIARVFNIAGPGQDERHVCGRFAAQTAAVLTGGADRVVAAGDLQTTRDFIDVRDAARALMIVAERGRPGQTINVATGQETPVAAILQTFLHLAEQDGHTVIRVERRPGSMALLRRQRADVRALQDLGFQPWYTLRHSCRDLLAYYLTDVAGAAGAPAEVLNA